MRGRKLGVPETRSELLQAVRHYAARSSDRYRRVMEAAGLVKGDAVDMIALSTVSDDGLRDILSAVKNEVAFTMGVTE